MVAQFGRKMMHGTDWFMPVAAAAREAFLARYQQALL